MRTIEPTEWVVYKAAGEQRLGGQHAVCSQQEWEAFERESPGRHTLICGHIRNESEAEQLARGLQVLPPPPKKVRPLTGAALKKQAERIARLAAYAKATAAGQALDAVVPPPAEPEVG